MKTAMETVQDRLIEYLIHDKMLYVMQLRMEYPEFEAEIDAYVQIWELSKNLPRSKRVFDVKAAWAKVSSKLEGF